MTVGELEEHLKIIKDKTKPLIIRITDGCGFEIHLRTNRTESTNNYFMIEISVG